MNVDHSQYEKRMSFRSINVHSIYGWKTCSCMFVDVVTLLSLISPEKHNILPIPRKAGIWVATLTLWVQVTRKKYIKKCWNLFTSNATGSNLYSYLHTRDRMFIEAKLKCDEKLSLWPLIYVFLATQSIPMFWLSNVRQMTFVHFVYPTMSTPIKHNNNKKAAINAKMHLVSVILTACIEFHKKRL